MGEGRCLGGGFIRSVGARCEEEGALSHIRTGIMCHALSPRVFFDCPFLTKVRKASDSLTEQIRSALSLLFCDTLCVCWSHLFFSRWHSRARRDAGVASRHQRARSGGGGRRPPLRTRSHG